MAEFARVLMLDKRGTGLGARVASVAAPGDVLATGTVRDLMAGSGFVFEDRGEHELKDVPGVWRLYAVASAE